MSQPFRIGNAHGFWGDRLSAAAEMLTAEPDLDYLTLDFLAEVSMSILALQWERDPAAGFPRDFVEIVKSIAPYWRAGGRCRVVTNAGGLNPLGCAQACLQILRDAGCANRKVAVVSGDDVLETLRDDARSGAHADLTRNLDTGEPIASVIDRLTTANAYVGAAPIVEALALGADLVITGRVADPSLTMAPCIQHFNWRPDDWHRLAGATVAGHLIECGAQVTGGIATDWMDVPDVERIGFPIVEVFDDGSCVVTKPCKSGGCVTEATVKEQLVYEIGDPGDYKSPDVTASFLTLEVRQDGQDRVSVRGATGRPAPSTLKVSATCRDGYRSAGQLTIFGVDALAKSHNAATAVLRRLQETGTIFRETLIESIGAGACLPIGAAIPMDPQALETVMRIAVASDSRDAVERFTRELMPLVTAGPPGTTGYSEGRPRVHPLFRYWPCLIDRNRVQSRVEVLSRGGEAPAERVDPTGCLTLAAQPELRPPSEPRPTGEITRSQRRSTGRLIDIAMARSGDKGRSANIGVIARRPGNYPLLVSELTPARVAAFLGIEDAARVTRYELPNLNALNFVVQDILSSSLRLDSQGKTLGQVLLQMPWNAAE